MTDTTRATGLTSSEVQDRQQQFGKNELTSQKKQNFFFKLLHILCEPMFLLLIIAAVIYFILGEPRDGGVMLVFVIGMISIDVIQEWKTDKTLNALKDLSAPQVTARPPYSACRWVPISPPAPPPAQAAPSTVWCWWSPNPTTTAAALPLPVYSRPKV